jgi:hypothetical protein
MARLQQEVPFSPTSMPSASPLVDPSKSHTECQVEATVSPVDNCITQQRRADDVVFTFVGDGSLVRVTTCFSETTTAHNFLLRNSGCGGGFGETVGSTDCPENPNTAAFQFETIDRWAYPIIVYPRNPGDSGAFFFQVTRVSSE